MPPSHGLSGIYALMGVQLKGTLHGVFERMLLPALSAEGFAAASPPRDVMPGTVLRATANVVALISRISSCGMTVLERDRSGKRTVNLYDGRALVYWRAPCRRAAWRRSMTRPRPDIDEANGEKNPACAGLKRQSGKDCPRGHEA